MVGVEPCPPVISRYSVPIHSIHIIPPYALFITVSLVSIRLVHSYVKLLNKLTSLWKQRSCPHQPPKKKMSVFLVVEKYPAGPRGGDVPLVT